jgi:hypothetical protein
LFKSLIESKINEIQKKSKGKTYKNCEEFLKQDPLTDSLLDMSQLYTLPFCNYQALNKFVFQYEIGKNLEILPDVDYVDDTNYDITVKDEDLSSDTSFQNEDTDEFEHPGIIFLFE